MSAVQAPKAASSLQAEAYRNTNILTEKMASGVLAMAADVAAPRARTPPNDAEPSIPL